MQFWIISSSMVLHCLQSSAEMYWSERRTCHCILQSHDKDSQQHVLHADDNNVTMRSDVIIVSLGYLRNGIRCKPTMISQPHSKKKRGKG